MKATSNGWRGWQALAHVASATPGPASARDGELVRIELVKSGGQWLIARAAPEAALAR